VDRTLPLPDVLPIFPLTGMLLLPGMHLPLHVFEPRYRNMVEDALAAGRHIGMVQPTVPRNDNAPGPDAPQDRPEVYAVGCAGAIEQYRRREDGRYLLTLVGVSRFRIREELAPLRGYRRIVPDYGAYGEDGAELAAVLDTADLLAALKSYGDAYQVAFDVEQMASLSSSVLVNGMAMSLPFRPAEKQALLEAPTLAERRRLVLDLLKMDLGAGRAEGPRVPPTLN
jgi:hypothetical protein